MTWYRTLKRLYDDQAEKRFHEVILTCPIGIFHSKSKNIVPTFSPSAPSELNSIRHRMAWAKEEILLQIHKIEMLCEFPLHFIIQN